MPHQYTPNDKFARKARFEGYRARSVYKLMELDEKYKLIKPGMTVLDVGAFPGSWLQYISFRIGAHGKVVGIDIQKIPPVEKNVLVYQEDITNHDAIKEILKQNKIDGFDLIVSDIAPNTTGISGVDHVRSIELSQTVVDLSKEFLKPRGSLVMKVFHGEKFAGFFKGVQSQFKVVFGAKVKASRDRSKEMYVVGVKKI